ncbi:MAG TPA: hypothetical protein VMJ66_13415 [Geobacteraceae bacterium]|nr:hypothetical protein [Geobacteraceae bacterium]
MPIEFLSVIPVTPGFVPAAASREVALEAFREMLPGAASVDVVVHEEISFIDSGVRFEKISCPICSMELDQIWWGDAMNTAGKRCFKDLKVQLPCCDAMSTLNDLNYRMPSGFARFLLKAREPKAGQHLAVDKMGALENILGTPLKQIWAHYKEFEQGQVRVHTRV